MARKLKIPTAIVPRFPIATMAWYAQYSDKVSGRLGAIEYAMGLTPGLTHEVTATWVDELIASTGVKVENEKLDELILSVAP